MYSKDHPTVKWFYDSFNSQKSSGGPTILENHWLRNLCLESGAADARFIEVDQPAIASQKGVILEALQTTKPLQVLPFVSTGKPCEPSFTPSPVWSSAILGIWLIGLLVIW